MPENKAGTVKGERKFDLPAFLAKAGTGRKVAAYDASQFIYLQGDTADSVFYINKGRISVSVTSKRGKEAIVAILGHGEFFGEGCLAGQTKRMSTAKTMTACAVTRIDKAATIRVLHDEPSFSEVFLQHLLARSIRIEEDLIDQLFNSSEKRLARVLLLLANFGKEGVPQTVIPQISQETLAEVVGTTRSRISHFMNKFRKLGFISYNGHIEVHSSLLNVVLHD
jgi:CRP/FNR family transcriptional regulator, cyclic AMP receptor protein